MKTEKESLTPMMKQFYDLKAKHPDALLLFRCGDFYETYSSDAVEASQILGITLTRRNNAGSKQQSSTEMAGFPYHALDTYLPKLVRAGKRVAICDQLEDPKLTKTLVKRGITEVVTPGVAMVDTVLNYKENNFLAAVHFGRTACGMALLDISTGEFLTTEGPVEHIDKLLAGFGPKEVLYERNRKESFEASFGNRYVSYPIEEWAYSEASAQEKLLRHFEVKNLKGFGIAHLKDGIVAAGVILTYLELTQHLRVGHITSIRRIEEERYVRLDKFTVRNLELVSPMNEDGFSLLGVIDKTVTPMGARMLHRWMLFPLKDVSRIAERHDVVGYFFRHPDFRQLVYEQLHQIGDLERIMAKASVGRITPRDIIQLRLALQAMVPIKQACAQADDKILSRVGEQLNPCAAIRDRIVQSAVRLLQNELFGG